jgi:hypothetical protein
LLTWHARAQGKGRQGQGKPSGAAQAHPRTTQDWMPAAMAATARVILRVTKHSPRRGDSWLNRMPLTANMPYDSR